MCQWCWCGSLGHLLTFLLLWTLPKLNCDPGQINLVQPCQTKNYTITCSLPGLKVPCLLYCVCWCYCQFFFTCVRFRRISSTPRWWRTSISTTPFSSTPRAPCTPLCCPSPTAAWSTHVSSYHVHLIHCHKVMCVTADKNPFGESAD